VDDRYSDAYNNETFMKINSTNGPLYVNGLTDRGTAMSELASYIFDYYPNLTMNYYKEALLGDYTKAVYRFLTLNQRTLIGAELFQLAELMNFYNSESPLMSCEIYDEKTTIIASHDSFRDYDNIINKNELVNLLSIDYPMAEVQAENLSRLICHKDEGEILVAKFFSNEEGSLLILQHLKPATSNLGIKLKIDEVNLFPHEDLNQLYLTLQTKEAAYILEDESEEDEDQDDEEDEPLAISLNQISTTAPTNAKALVPERFRR
jgi:hypothetical protein